MENNNLRWVLWTPVDIASETDRALTVKRKQLDDVIAVQKHGRTFRNTIAALECADDELSDLHQQLTLLLSVHPDPGVRNAAQHHAGRIDEENVAMSFDCRLWTAVEEWQELDEALDAADAKLARDTIRDMRRMGFALPDAEFERLKRNVAELQQLQTSFEAAINDWEDAIVISREQLAGLPERYINTLSREGERYRVTLEYPEFYPFMRQADDEALRHELASKNLTKGGRKNLELLARMITLRQENARLLGYASHADYVTEPRMARTGAAASTFVRDIMQKLEPAAQKELADLLALKERTLKQSGLPPLKFHETAYWGYKMLRERYGVDAELLKEYFPLQRVIDGMLSVYQSVLGVTFRPVVGTKLWHDDVKLFDVVSGDSPVGQFILDMHPRKGKYGHAAAFPAVLGRARMNASPVRGLVALVCNFPKPTDEHPSLLSHEEVETLFHEFGHVMHALLSAGRWQSQNGFGVPLDFVEAMSQLFEEWAWNPVVLQRISGHFRTGEPVPDALMQSLIAARHHMDAFLYHQQAVKALYDLEIHSRPTHSAVDGASLASHYRTLSEEHLSAGIPEDSVFPAGWGHMADYDAGYYGYLWSKVYALDLYSRFAHNPMDSDVGSAYRRCVLEPGASSDELGLVRTFLGREPSNAAFLSELGISKNSE